MGRREPRLPDRVDRRPARRGQAVRGDQQRQPGPVGRRVRRRHQDAAAGPAAGHHQGQRGQVQLLIARSPAPGGAAVRRDRPAVRPRSPRTHDSRPAVEDARGRRSADRPRATAPIRPRARGCTLTGISKRFGAVRAIRNADITIRAGRVHALVGENGAGKSTMIKIISGVEAADTGTIEFEGRPVDDLIHRRRHGARHRDRVPGAAAVRRADGLGEHLHRPRDPQAAAGSTGPSRTPRSSSCSSCWACRRATRRSRSARCRSPSSSRSRSRRRWPATRRCSSWTSRRRS